MTPYLKFYIAFRESVEFAYENNELLIPSNIRYSAPNQQRKKLIKYINFTLFEQYDLLAINKKLT